MQRDKRSFNIKEFVDFNTAMLRKQFWRLIENTNSLACSKVDISEMSHLLNPLDRTRFLMVDIVLYQLDFWLTND